MITTLGDSFSTSAGDSHGIQISRYSTNQAAIIRHKVIAQSYIFSFLQEGTKAVHTDRNRIAIQSDQFLLILPGNYLMSEKIASPNGEFRTILFLISEGALTHFFARHPPLAVKPAEINAVQVFNKSAFIHNFMTSLDLMLDEDSAMPAAMKQVKMEELLLYLCRHFPERMNGLRQMAVASGSDFEIKKIAEANIESNVTLEELAFLCNMSLSTFKRKFTRLYGVPPAKWFLQKKMELAGALLRSGKEKPSEVFYKVGFESHSSFAHSFKHMFGLTPSEYRENAIK